MVKCSKLFYSVFVYITIFNCFFDAPSLNSTFYSILETKLLSNLGNPYKFMGVL